MATTTIQEQILREAPEIEAIKLGLLQSGRQLADIPVQLPEQQVAGFSPLQQQAFTGVTGPQGIGAYLPGLAAGQATLGTGLGALTAAQTAAGAGTGLFAPTDLGPYTNPFQQAVIDATLQRLDEEGARAQNQLGAQAAQAGAFGGSRFGVESAQLGENLQDARARILAQLNSQNFLQALQTGQSAFQNQQQRQQQEAQLLSGIGGQQAAIGGQQIGAGQAAQTSGLKDLAVLQQLGGQQQGLQQALLDAQRANERQQLFEPHARVSFLSDIYKGAPSTQTSLGSVTSPTAPAPSAFQQIAGAGTGLLGLGVAGQQLGGLFS